MPKYPKILNRITDVMRESTYPSQQFVRKMLSLGFTKQNFINFVDDNNLIDGLLSKPTTIKIDTLNNSFVKLKIIDYDITETKNEKFLLCYDFELVDSSIEINGKKYTLLSLMESNENDFVKEHVQTMFTESFIEKMKDEYYFPFIFSPDAVRD
jgi:hypothetical protein